MNQWEKMLVTQTQQPEFEPQSLDEGERQHLGVRGHLDFCMYGVL